MNLEVFAAAALGLLVLLLVLGGAAKLVTAGRDAEPGGLSRLGPAVLVPEHWRRSMLILCAAVEFVLAPGLLFTRHPLFRWWTALFFAVATYVLVELRRRRPDAGCGCFGEASGTPVGVRSIGRAVVLAGMAALVAFVPVSGADLLSAPLPDLALALAAGLVVLAVLSPELEEAVARLRYRAPCEQRPASPAKALVRLRSSAEWRSHEALLTSGEPSDSWRELCWRFFVYPGRTASGAEADVVFAVHLSGRRPAVRAAVVESEDAGGILQESIGVSAEH
ncbi:MauE/DoxX family redox-associated membrane protein [Sphaerisporangium fuscum]|uniref:MauE/DoxX family redox-associated membrane protein n=1 Tax=Sphaerisporangium fuscum TaxID=2835868 RepID=UPI0035583000